MRLRTKLWLWWNGYCTKHGEPRDVGKGGTLCPECIKEVREQHQKRLAEARKEIG